MTYWRKKVTLFRQSKPGIRAENAAAPGYDHAKYEWRRQLCRFLLRRIAFTLLTRVDEVEGLEHVPTEGPAVLMMNHIAYVDPIVLIHTMPRNVVPLAKSEAYHHPLEGIFPRIWGVIPVYRGTFDRKAVKQALSVLAAGEIILVAPEGTRRPALHEAREGAVYLASRSNAPILPAALEYTEGFPSFPLHPRWKERGAHVKFGRPFRFRQDFRRARGTQLRKMADEAMYVLASMLLPHRRGVYSDMSQATQETIEWV